MNSKYRSLLPYLFALLPFSSLLSAKTTASIKDATGVGAPITAFSADTMAKGSWGVSQRTEYYRNRPVTNEVLINNLSAESQTGAFFDYLMLNYGLSNSFTLGASLPYAYTSNLKAGQEVYPIPEVHHLGNISGLSDLNLYALSQVLNNEQTSIMLSLLVGLTVPTGKSNVLDISGFPFSTSDQPGKGAFNAINGVVLSKSWDSLALSFNVFYTQNTQGEQNTILGAMWNYNAAAVYQFYEQEKKGSSLEGIMELNGTVAAQDTINGLKDLNSGGQSLFLLAGLRDNFTASSSFYLGLTVPVMEHYYGTQVHTEYGLISGIDISLN